MFAVEFKNTDCDSLEAEELTLSSWTSEGRLCGRGAVVWLGVTAAEVVVGDSFSNDGGAG